MPELKEIGLDLGGAICDCPDARINALSEVLQGVGLGLMHSNETGLCPLGCALALLLTVPTVALNAQEAVAAAVEKDATHRPYLDNLRAGIRGLSIKMHRVADYMAEQAGEAQ